MPHIHPHPELRESEEIIEEFGVSRIYTRTLQGTGFILGGVGLLALLIGLPVLGNVLSLFLPVSALVAILTNVVVLLVGFYLFGLGFYLQHARRYYLTNQRVIAIRGLWVLQTTSVEYRSITDIQVHEDLGTRWIFRIGSVGINTAGGGMQEIILGRIDNPDRCQATIRHLTELAHQATVAADQQEQPVSVTPESAPTYSDVPDEPSVAAPESTPIQAEAQEFQLGTTVISTDSAAARPVQPAPGDPRTPEEIRHQRSSSSHEVRSAQRHVDIPDQ